VASIVNPPRQWPSKSPPRHHVSTSECQVAVVVHCQHTVKGHLSGSSGKPWDDWPFPTCPSALPCLDPAMACHAILPIRTDWDEGPRGARSCAALRLARKQMWKRRKLSEVGLDPSEGRSDPLVTCKCRRAPRVKPGRGSITTGRVSVVAIRRHPQGGVRLIAVRLTVPFFHSSTTTPHPSTSTTAASQSRPNGTPCATAVLGTVFVYYLPRQ